MTNWRPLILALAHGCELRGERSDPGVFLRTVLELDGWCKQSGLMVAGRAERQLLWLGTG